MLKLYKKLKCSDYVYNLCILFQIMQNFCEKKNASQFNHVHYLITDLIIIIFNSENCSPRNCMIHIAPIVSYSAIPSIFIAAPIGIINFVILGFMPRPPKHLIVQGTVAVLNYTFNQHTKLCQIHKFSCYTLTTFQWLLQKLDRVWI